LNPILELFKKYLIQSMLLTVVFSHTLQESSNSVWYEYKIFSSQEVAGLIGDIISTFRNQSDVDVNVDEVKEIIEYLKESGDEEAQQIALWLLGL